ncbi:ethA [Symbiodinium natans]|uniref:EthA protein n=1 Tax=Symbiodinium natans TaxID=878477 RepID=A0A812JMG0_9DINO|nr:ethA [Symbiodinium natans]
MDQKADAAEVLQYLKDFVNQCGLQPNIHSETLVKEVHYDSKSRLAHLVVAKESVEKREGPYNLVIFASLSGSAKMPDIPNRGFTGKLLHSCELKAKTMSEIIDAKSSVLVIGAGKSGCDMIQAFQKAAYENVMWLYRQPYWFFSFETFFHDRSLLSMLRAFLALVFVTLSLASPSLCMFALWVIGYAIMPGCSGWPKHFNAVRFHFGMLCERQLSFIKKVKPVTGDPDHFQKGGVVLKSGEAIDCDVIICATGYNTGLDTIQCIKDGKPISVTGCPLYEHAIVPRFPCLISAATAFYHFGPIRGVSLAEQLHPIHADGEVFFGLSWFPSGLGSQRHRVEIFSPNP